MDQPVRHEDPQVITRAEIKYAFDVLTRLMDSPVAKMGDAHALFAARQSLAVMLVERECAR